MTFRRNYYVYLGLLTVVILSGLIFYYSFYFQVWQIDSRHWVSDLPVHADLLISFVKEDKFPAYTVWYRLVYFVSGLSTDYSRVAWASIFLLAISVGAKYFLTYKIIDRKYSNAKINAFVAFVLTFSMAVVSYYSCESAPSALICVSNTHVYLGNVGPNQWHNSTLILAMPFSILWFWYSIENINNEGYLAFLSMGLLGALSVLSKPNFTLAFLPVLCAGILISNFRPNGILRSIKKIFFVAVPSFGILLYQWYSTFFRNEIFAPSGTTTAFKPFLVWSAYSPNIPLSFVLSIAFPMVFLLLFYKQVNIFLRYSWFTFLVSLTITALFAESPGYEGGNFFWGTYAANYILFVFTAASLLAQPVSWKTRVSYLFLGIHFFRACTFLVHFFCIRERS